MEGSGGTREMGREDMLKAGEEEWSGGWWGWGIEVRGGGMERWGGEGRMGT